MAITLNAKKWELLETFIAFLKSASPLKTMDPEADQSKKTINWSGSSDSFLSRILLCVVYGRFTSTISHRTTQRQLPNRDTFRKRLDQAHNHC